MRHTAGTSSKRSPGIAMTLLTLMIGFILIVAGCGTGASVFPASPSGSAAASSDTGPGEGTTPEPMSSSTPAPSEQTVSSAEPASPAVEPVDMRIGGLTGPTSMGMVGIMQASKAGTASNRYSFTIAGAADELTPKLLQGDLDMLAVPANLAAVLHNNSGGKVRLLAVNTLGVLYMVEKGETVQSFSDLKGKTILATGKGSTPEYALRYLLAQNGMDPDKDVTLEWKSEPAEVVAILSKAEGGVAMMPQPYVTIAQGQVEGLRVAADLTKEWDALNNGSTLITGVMAVRADFADAHPDQLAAFLDEYRASADFVNANPAEAAALIEEFGIFKAAVAQKAIPYCNITFLEGEGMKTAMQGYLSVLFDQNPKAVGGKLPEDMFYFTR